MPLPGDPLSGGVHRLQLNAEPLDGVSQMRIAVAVILLLSVACSTSEGQRARRKPQPPSISWNIQRAMNRPCEYTGTLHSASRSHLENLRRCGEITESEWRCLSDELATGQFSAECRSRVMSYEEFRSAQRTAYSECVDPVDVALLDRATDHAQPFIQCSN
jgi:hypothetical protein